MKINNIKINSYGNLKNKEIILSENINIIEGKNESGKSTLLKFISNMFYGISKNKKGKEFSDYDRYKPWDTEEFSGKIKYTLEDGRCFEVFRDFNKKNPKIYNELSEDITKEFNINKTTGSEFFYDQTNIDENIFLSTLVSIQQEVKIDRGIQNTLIQKIANFTSTGDDNTSYEKAIEKINKKQIEEIGTDRTQGRPINLIRTEKEKIEKEKEELINLKNMQYEIEEEKNKLEEQTNIDEKKLEIIKQINLLNEKEKLNNNEIQLNNKIIFENEQEIEKLKQEKIKIEEKIKNNTKNEDEIINENDIKNIDIILKKYNFKEEEKLKIEKQKNKILGAKKQIKNINLISISTLIIFLLIAIINIMFIKIKFVSQIFFLAIPIVFLIYFCFKIIYKNKIKEEELKLKDNIKMSIRQKVFFEEEQKNELHKLENQIEILEQSIHKQKNEIKKIIEKNDKEVNFEKEKIKNKFLNENIYIKDINNENLNIKNNDEIEKYFNNKNLINEINFIENEINKNKLNIHKLELDKNNLIPKLEKLSNMEERLQELNEQEENLLKENKSIELTKQILEIAYNKMKENVTPKFTNNLSKNIEKISDGKYKNVKINDEDGIIIEKENGEYISAEKLSVGTIEQLYLSLRFALINEISKENMPIILDEAFAYYDTERLKNILKFLANEFKNNQIIIFTCTNREKEILEEENIDYNLITM